MTQANSAKQLTFGGTLLYRDKQIVDTALGNVFKSSQSNAPNTQRWDFGNDFRYLLGDRWYVNTTQDFMNSDEQGLDLRTTIGGGGGRYLFRSASQHLALGAGLAWTNEKYKDPAVPTKDSYLGTEFMTEKLKVTDLIELLRPEVLTDRSRTFVPQAGFGFEARPYCSLTLRHPRQRSADS
jgi:putative salt-induced outer membrane protein YdiY